MTLKQEKSIYGLINGKMVRVSAPVRPSSANFVIVCDYGDWSGFRTLPDCERQFPELETMAAKSNRSNFYYRVVER